MVTNEERKKWIDSLSQSQLQPSRVTQWFFSHCNTGIVTILLAYVVRNCWVNVWMNVPSPSHLIPLTRLAWLNLVVLSWRSERREKTDPSNRSEHQEEGIQTKQSTCVKRVFTHSLHYVSWCKTSSFLSNWLKTFDCARWSQENRPTTTPPTTYHLPTIPLVPIANNATTIFVPVSV